MNIYESAFSIVQSGSWPNETFSISLSDDLIDPNLGFLPIVNRVSFLKNPLNSIANDFLQIGSKKIGTNSLINYNYYNASEGLSNQGLYQLDFNSNSSMLWETSALRRNYEVGPLFNIFQIDVTPGEDFFNKQYYGYLAFPPKLQLKPTSLTKVGANWVLATQTVVRSTSTLYTNFSSIDVLSYDLYKTYTRSSPITQALPAGYTLFYEICATSTRNALPVINFTELYNPNYVSLLLEPNGSKIRPDSTSIFFDVEYFSSNQNGTGFDLISLKQEQPVYTNAISPFHPTYLLNFDPFKDPNKQQFQLIQKMPLALSMSEPLTLGLSGYCVLSGVFDLNISNFKYFNNSYYVRKGNTNTLVNVVTGVPDTNIAISYIVDRPRILFTNETVQSTASIAGNTTTFGTPVSTNPIQSLTWTTKYPPHYYCYRASLSSNTYTTLSSQFMDVDSLTFYLYSEPISGTTTSLTLSTYIKSDFNFLKYDLSTNNYREYIKYTPVISDEIVLSALKCFYGPNLNKEYSIFNTPWIPVSAGQNFIVTYPQVDYGEITFVLKPTLSTVNGFLDSKDLEPIILAQGLPPSDGRGPMTIDTIDEGQDYIVADASDISNESFYPFRDLTNSYISWFFYPSSQYMRIEGVDLNGQYLTTIPAYSAVLFGEKTWTVKISGYGPQSTSIFLSSQKYNRVASVTSNSALFDLFADNRFIVGPSIQLNNLNYTRTITLTAAVPYKGRIYNIPSDTILNWIWTYDGVSTSEDQLIRASYTNQPSAYVYGYEDTASNLSSINLKVTTPYADASPDIHNVVAYVYSFTRSPALVGYYSFNVDDFPSPSLFNTDFLINYATGSKPNIINTRVESLNNRTAIITRPLSSTSVFSLTANTDVLPSIVFPNINSIVWSVSNNQAGVVSTSNFTSGTNVFYNLNLTSTTARKTIISLSALQGIVPGWISAHNIVTDAVFYILPSIEFETPLSFVLYPSYAWRGGPYLTLLNNDNYTLALAPTAYANKISNSQSYSVSANFRQFSSYLYSANTNNILTTTSSFSAEINVPYTSHLYSVTGQQINLTAYNTEYPEYNGTTFIDHYGKKITYPNNRSTTVPFYLSSTQSLQFKRNPRIIPYDDVTFSFSIVNTGIDLNQNRFITVYQTISSNNPVQPILNSSTITYGVSTDYWYTETTKPATNGYTSIIFLNVGDPYYPGFVSGTKNSKIYLNATANVLTQIPPSTFDNYNPYNGERNLWSTVYQKVTANLTNPWKTLVTYNTAVDPEIYLSSYYTTTSYPILIQFSSPPVTEKLSNVVVNYSISVDQAILTIPASGYVYYYPDNVGSFNISYSAFYLDSSVKKFDLDTPLIVKANWQEYNQEDIRILDEATLTLPYNAEQIEIQPNEWGDVDIFNTAIGRVYDNLEYLKSNCQTINADAPTIYYGWLGCNSTLMSEGIRWFTQTYGKDSYNLPSRSANARPRCANCEAPISYFSSIKGVAESNTHIFALDGSMIRAFSAGKIPVERNFSNIVEISSIFVTPQSLAIDNTGTVLYTVDSSKNQIFKFDLDLSYVPYINISSIIGNFGSRTDTNKFNTPVEIVYQNKEVYVLDFGNTCIKQYNEDLNWLHTYYVDEFFTNKPINLAIHPSNLIYVLTQDYKIHIFDRFVDEIVQTIDLYQVRSSGETIVKIIFDEPGEFLYIVTNSQIYKYTAAGYFLSILNIPDDNTYTSANYSPNRNLLFTTGTAIIKTQDILDIFRIGSGLPSAYWSKDQILVERKEMAQDFVYNRALKRIAQNIKTFRNNLNSKFVIVSESTDLGILYYFTLKPINASQLPSLDTDVEAENLFVGTNELHIPQSLNKELIKLYNSLTYLTSFLNVKDDRLNNEDGTLCSEPFCWSWKSTSCYGLKLPAIRVCNVNPITYDELKASFSINYAPTKSWGSAISKCCKDIQGPIIV
jgi:hypothetical protein